MSPRASAPTDSPIRTDYKATMLIYAEGRKLLQVREGCPIHKTVSEPIRNAQIPDSGGVWRKAFAEAIDVRGFNVLVKFWHKLVGHVVNRP